MKIEVVYSRWTADGGIDLAGGKHEIEKPSATVLRMIAGAEAGGAVRVLSATKDERKALDRHVQSQEDGEAALAAAMGEPDEGGQASGPWQHGNHVDFIAQRRALLDSDEVEMTKAERAAAERDVADAEARLSKIEEPS